MIASLLRNRTKINFFLDILLVLLFTIEYEYHFTGLRLHELIGLAFAAAMLIHFLLHLDWVWSITKTFFRNLIHETRLNYILNAILLIDACIMVISGVLISRTLGLSFTLGRVLGLSWERIHILSAELSLVVIAFHIAMHWKWLGNSIKTYLWPHRAK
jgi:hypothetical protein